MKLRLKKIFILALYLLFISVTAFSLIFMIEYAEHECCPDACHTCVHINVAQRLLSQIGTAFAVSICVVATFGFLRTLYPIERPLFFSFSPIALKVRLNN